MTYDADLALGKFVRPEPNDVLRRQSERVPVPDQIVGDKYRVERVLGVGGMGIVVAARHVRLEQRVALKFILPDHTGNTELVERFMREARAAAKVQSDHVRRIFDFAALPDGTPYIVMEYLDGCDLAALLCAEGRLCVERAVDYLLQTCVAVSEAHHLGIVHRDLKPENLFLTRRADGSACIKVLDFGISKLVKSTDGVSTAASFVMGSPMYMSPEQLRSCQDLDMRADIWSLGVVLFELLTGRQPFIADRLEQLCKRVLEAEAPRLRNLLPDAPTDLDEVIHRCLQKDPADRFGSVADLARAIRPFAPPSTDFLEIHEKPTGTLSKTTTIVQSWASGSDATKPRKDRHALSRRLALPTGRRHKLIALFCVIVPVTLLGIGRLRCQRQPGGGLLSISMPPQMSSSPNRNTRPEPNVTQLATSSPIVPKEELEEEHVRYLPTRPSDPLARTHDAGTRNRSAASRVTGTAPSITASEPGVAAIPDDRK